MDFSRRMFERLSPWKAVNKFDFRRMYLPIYASLMCILATSIPSVSASANFNQCLEEVRQGRWGPDGGTNNLGVPVPVSEATAITYDLCVKACGTDSEAFVFSAFSQQFSAWLLPWLALVSNLPFGATIRQHNLLSVFLVVGSPTLAAYSLALTVLNGQWIALRFRGLKYPNVHLAVQVLRNLQQVPLKVYTDNGLLSSLVILPKNDHWWKDLSERLDYTYTWSIASATSIAWVVIAYIFTLIDSFTNIGDNNFNSSGQGVGSAWLWLLPIVAGWLFLSPKSDYDRVYGAVRRANRGAYVATPRGVVKAGTQSQKFAFSLQRCHDSPAFRINECSPPVFNYARFLPWVQAVEEVHSAFEAAADKAHHNKTVDGRPWTGQGEVDIDQANRTGSLAQIEAYCTPSRRKRKHNLGPDVFSRMFTASIIAIGLQWGTTGAAVIVQFFTPTRGLGCRSASYLLYAAISTLIWGMLVVSSVLAHYSTAGDRLAIEDSIVMDTFSPSDDRSPYSESASLPDSSTLRSASPAFPEPFPRPGTGGSQAESSTSRKGKFSQGDADTSLSPNALFPHWPGTGGVDRPTSSGSITSKPEHSSRRSHYSVDIESPYPSVKEKDMLLGGSPVPIITQEVEGAEGLEDDLPATARFAAQLSVILRRIAYTLAVLNAIWLIAICFFQITKFLSQCYCDSSYLGLRSRAYAVFTPNLYDIAIMRKAWLAGVGLGASCSLVFFGFIWMYPANVQVDY